ncbi:hypothetical protein Tco_0025277 [Tanacetum coccineum]
MSHTNLSQQQSGSYQQASQEIQEEEDETEPVPTPTSKKPGSRGKRVKSMAKKTVEPEPQCRNRQSLKFLEPRGKHKWNNPESTQARRNCHRVPEPELFGDDALPRPPGMHRIAKSQRSSNSSTSSESNPAMFQEMMQQQFEIERKEKMERIDREVNSRVALNDSKRVAEDLKVLQISTDGMDPIDTAIVNTQKARIRALYNPNN